MQLPVTLPISGKLDSNIYGKTYAVTKQSAKTMKLLPQNKSHILGLQEYIDNPEMHPLVRYTNTTKYLGIPGLPRSTVARGTANGKELTSKVPYMLCPYSLF